MNSAAATQPSAPSMANNLDAIQPANADFLAKPRGLLIDGSWVAAASGKTFEVRDPSSDRIIAHCALGDAADIGKAVAAARRAFEAGDWARMKPVDRERFAAPLGRSDRTACGRTGRARGHRQRQIGGNRPACRHQARARGVALHGGLADQARGQDPARVRHAGAGPGIRRLFHPRADRRRRRRHCVEFPVPARHLEMRARARRGLYGGAEAGRGDSVDRAASGRTGTAGGIPERRVQRRHRHGPNRRRGAVVPPGRRQDHLHRLDRRGAPDRPGRRRAT